jgi:hypothetical protein
MSSRNSLWCFVPRILSSKNSTAPVTPSSCSALHNIQRWEDPIIRQVAIKIRLHIAGAYELLEDDLVHTTAGVDQSGGDNRHAPSGLDVARRGEKLSWLREGGGLHTA